MIGKILNVRFCRVLSIDDDTDSDRIKVQLSPEDNNKSIEQIDYAFPLLPKMFHVKPKVGEAVLVLLSVTNDGNSQRYYIGPVISQDHKLFKDPYLMGADSYLRGAYKKFDIAPSTNPTQKGILPNDEDICIRGRKNTDIQITEDDIRVKAGVKLVEEGDKYKMSFNEKNPGYIKIKYHLNPLEDGSQSTTSIVSDKIFLLSNSSPNYFKTTDREHLITDEEYNNVLNKAYKLPYGEILVDFLNVFIKAFVEHTHNFIGLPPNPYFTSNLIEQKATLLDQKQMLSDTVRIN
jgi:hypothetical protein